MSVIKDSINKGFTVGEVTTVNFDDEAKIKVKEFYELDRLERKKTLELAGRVDAELIKRDSEIESISKNVSSIESDIIEVKKNVTEINGRVSEIENNGTGGGESSKGYYALMDAMTNAYVFYKFEVPQEELDKLGQLSLDYYNKLSPSDQTPVKNALAKIGITDPTDLESMENELSKSEKTVSNRVISSFTSINSAVFVSITAASSRVISSFGANSVSERPFIIPEFARKVTSLSSVSANELLTLFSLISDFCSSILYAK